MFPAYREDLAGTMALRVVFLDPNRALRLPKKDVGQAEQAGVSHAGDRFDDPINQIREGGPPKRREVPQLRQQAPQGGGGFFPDRFEAGQPAPDGLHRRARAGRPLGGNARQLGEDRFLSDILDVTAVGLEKVGQDGEGAAAARAKDA